jgi:hypothetical protein
MGDVGSCGIGFGSERQQRDRLPRLGNAPHIGRSAAFVIARSGPPGHSALPPAQPTNRRHGAAGTKVFMRQHRTEESAARVIDPFHTIIRR